MQKDELLNGYLSSINREETDNLVRQLNKLRSEEKTNEED